MDVKKDYGLVNYNIKDSIGEFIYEVKLTDRIKMDSNGYLHCKDAVVGNVGIQIYKGYELGLADGESIVKVHRKEEYIFAEDSLKTLEDKPITLNHPSEMVNSENYRKYARGHIKGAVRRDGENMVCDLVIQDKELIDMIAPEDENGNRHISNEFRDLSLGYNAKLEPYGSNGEYVQKDIEYNHLAVVKAGRAANAIIRDSLEKKEGGRKPMKLFDWLRGSKIKPHEDGSFTIVDEDGEEKVVSKSEVTVKEERIDPYDKDKKITSERKTTEVVKEENGEEAKIEEEKKGETVMKDKAYFTKAFADAQKLPDGPFKEDTIKQLNDEYLEVYPRAKKEVKDAKNEESVLETVKVTDSQEIDELNLKNKKETIDFDYLERESKEYYDKLSNPESKYHKDHKAWEDFYKLEVRTGRSNLNL